MKELLIGLRSTSDGWRAIIAKGFTFANVCRITWAVGQYVKTQSLSPYRAIVAYDTRFMGKLFAQAVCNTLNGQGISCDIVQSPIPTPVLSWYTHREKYDIGLTVTASHNPPYYNGLKIRMPYGGPPDKEVMTTIESLLLNSPGNIPTDEHPANIVDPRSDYVQAIRNLIDLSAINEARPVVAIDSMHGTTTGLLQDILRNTHAKVIQVRGNPDPLFGGVSPEPKAKTIWPLIEAVKQEDCQLGLAHDGDGDRIVAFDSDVGYLSPHDLITLLAFDLAKRRGLSGSIVASVSTTRRVKAISQMLGRVYHEVPIGFHNASRIMRHEDVLLAGEENGGIGVGHHLPERDGTLIAAYLVEIISSRRTGLGALLSIIEEQIKPSHFLRRDIEVTNSPKNAVQKYISNTSDKLLDFKIVDVHYTDGVKLILDNGAWVLVRAAGTEPLVRIYAEADDATICEALVDATTESLLDNRRTT